MIDANRVPGRLQDRVAIVTGASSGLGRAISLRYASEGARVVCSDLRPDAPRESDGVSTHDAIVKSGGEAIFVKTDVGESSEMEALVAAAVEKYGRLDIMVNNAGVALEQSQAGGAKRMHETDEKIFDGSIKVNSKGVWLGCKYAIAQMLKQDIIAENGDRGWIVNTASVAGWIGIPNASSYIASKHACVGITRVAALEYGPDKIHVNAICPGYIETPMTEKIRAHDAYLEQTVAQHPWGRYGKPDEIAKAAVFLASDDASFMTGVPMPVDGGYLAR